MTYITESNPISLLIAVLFSIALSALIIRRKCAKKAKKGQKISLLETTYIFVVIGTLSCLFVPFSTQFIQPTMAYFDLPRYEAKVVDVDSKWEEINYTDLDGNNFNKGLIMYTSTLEFKDNEGNIIRKLNNISSATKPSLSKNITVIYHDEKMQEFSFRAIIKKFEIGLILAIMGYFLLLLTVLIEVMILY